MRRIVNVALLTLIVLPAWAGPEILPVKGMKYATYDMATGQLTPTTGPERVGDSVWASTQRCGFYFIQMSYGPGTTSLDWGDIAGPQEIGGFTFSYGTDLVLPERLDVVIRFYAEENGFNSAGRVFLAGFRMANLPTGDPGGAWYRWTITVDLDPDGSQFTIEGSDLDWDGLTDFGYTYWFTEMTPTADNHTGPFVAGEPNFGTAPGIEDAFDVFNDPNLQEFRETYVFSGGPFAQFYMELFDSDADRCPRAGSSGKRCFADIDCEDHPCDCLVDLRDLAKFLSVIGVPGEYAWADLEPWPDGDGDVDLADLAELLSQYEDDCN